MKYASFWSRFLAYLIDVIIVSVVSNVAGLRNYSFLIQLIYFVGFWVKQDGQTLGNKIMKIKVVRENKQKMDISTGIIRYLSYILSGIALCLGFLWVIWDKKKQGWHDKIAKTLVINVRS